jgi:TctA family transporter
MVILVFNTPSSLVLTKMTLNYAFVNKMNKMHVINFMCFSLMLLILNMPLVKVFAKIIETPPTYLIPMIIAISVFGVYAVQVSLFDLGLLLVCGVAGYFLSKHDYPIAPLVLGLVLGPMIENNMRRALTISNGDYSIFINHPVSALFLLAAAGICRQNNIPSYSAVLKSGPNIFRTALFAVFA